MKISAPGIAMILSLGLPLQGADPDPEAWDKLRDWVPGLDGTGVQVAQAEADGPGWQVNPQVVGQPAALFTWQSSNGTTNQFPNSLGTASDHANSVGARFYGQPDGAAPGVQQVDNYEALHFYSLVQSQSAVDAVVVNQSFTFNSEMLTVDLDYDNYAERFGTLFVSGVGNGDDPKSPGTAYNGIAVGAWNGAASHGPTGDGRSKPDLTAPASLTSYSTPQVSGAAALLIQAARAGMGGPDTNEAEDYRTLKALLLNGTDKPSNWTNGPTAPLDARHGTGVLNPLRSHHQLRGGRQSLLTTASYASGAPHPPPAPGSFVPSRRGWDLNSVSSTVTSDRANHYYFDLTTNGNAIAPFELSVTLVWSRQMNRTAINDLDLFLYDASDGSLVISSESAVNNVEHLHVPELGPGSYVLQVFKYGGLLKRVTNNETYALAFSWDPMAVASLEVAPSPAGQFTGRLVGEPHERYVIESTTNLATWTPTLTNTAPASGWFEFSEPVGGGPGRRFFRSRLAP